MNSDIRKFEKRLRNQLTIYYLAVALPNLIITGIVMFIGWIYFMGFRLPIQSDKPVMLLGFIIWVGMVIVFDSINMMALDEGRKLQSMIKRDIGYSRKVFSDDPDLQWRVSLPGLLEGIDI